MTDMDAFLQAHLESPFDHAPLLVWADWLDERNHPLGKLIRLCLDFIMPGDEWFNKKPEILREWRFNLTGMKSSKAARMVMMGKYQKIKRSDIEFDRIKDGIDAELASYYLFSCMPFRGWCWPARLFARQHFWIDKEIPTSNELSPTKSEVSRLGMSRLIELIDKLPGGVPHQVGNSIVYSTHRMLERQQFVVKWGEHCSPSEILLQDLYRRLMDDDRIWRE